MIVFSFFILISFNCHSQSCKFLFNLTHFTFLFPLFTYRAINAIRPIEIKTTSSIESQQEKNDRQKLSPIRTSYAKQMDEQITSEFKPEIFQVTTDDETGLRSVVELLASEQTEQSRNSSVRVSTSVKDRLGKKVIKKSRSRSPKAVKVKVSVDNKGFQRRSRDKSTRSSKDERSYGASSSSRNNESNNRQHVFVSSVSSKSSIDRRGGGGGGGGEDRRDSHTIDRSRVNRNDVDFSRNVRNQNSSSSSSKRTSKVEKVSGHSPNAREITRDHNTRGTSKHKSDKNQTESSKSEKEKYQQKKDVESSRKPELSSNKNDTKDARHSSSSHVTKSSSSTAAPAAAATTTSTATTKESKTPKKHTRSSSTSSCTSTQSGNSNASSAKQSKKHSSYKSKSKKKYRSSSTESISLKRKKVKKIKKSKKKKTRK